MRAKTSIDIFEADLHEVLEKAIINRTFADLGPLPVDDPATRQYSAGDEQQLTRA